MKNLLLILMFISTWFSGFATQLTVTNTNDSGAGSLRDQVAAAAATDTILFASSLDGGVITLTSGHISFSKTLTIIGPGYDLLTISGNQNSRIFNISGGEVTIKGLKLIDGSRTGSSPNDGGAINHVNAGNLTLNNVYFDNNVASNGNGSQGGAVFYAVNGGTVVADFCFFMNSESDNYGGAVSFNASPASVSINHCWFDGNAANNGPCGTLFTNAQSLIVQNSTFSNNSAVQRANIWTSPTGSGTEAYEFTNCTFSNNTASIPYRELDVSSGTLSLVNCTFSDNNEPVVVSQGFFGGGGSLVAQNSIFNNDGNNFQSSGSVVLTSLGGNISNDASMSSFLNATNDINSTPVLIGELANYGGLMDTHELLSGSPAIDNGINTGAPSFDQIGNARDATYDSGSLEYASCEIVNGTDVRVECNSFTWIDGNTYNADNNEATFTIIGGAISGCDSVVTLNLTINNSTSGTDEITACDSYTWIDGNTYTSDNNEATHTLENAAGCDSVVTLNLTINNSTSGTDEITACDSYIWIDGNTYTSDNNEATHTLVNSTGCDSVVTLALTINTVDNSVTQSGATLTANNEGATYQWLDCDANFEAIEGMTNQSFTATENGTFAVEVTNDGCVMTSDCFVITPLGLAENAFKDNIRLFPNPTNGDFSIDLGSVYTNVEVSISDITGKQIRSATFGSSQVIRMSINENRGVYIISIQAEEKSAIVRLVKN